MMLDTLKRWGLTNKMKDRDFLVWLYKRLTIVHKERPTLDYMCKLRAIIKNTPKDRMSQNIDTDSPFEDLTEKGKTA